MCPKCGFGTRAISKRWARCKRCGARVERRALPSPPEAEKLPAAPRRFVRMFKPQFSGLVRSGAKQQTVRPVPKRMPRTGDIIDCRAWCGKPFGSKHRRLGQWKITSVYAITISYHEIAHALTPDDLNSQKVFLRRTEQAEFAMRDGFDSFGEMADWFQVEHGLPFEGIVINWGPPDVSMAHKTLVRKAGCATSASGFQI